MDRNRQKMTETGKTDRNGQKTSKTDRIDGVGPKWTETDRNIQKRTEMGRNGHKRT